MQKKAFAFPLLLAPPEAVPVPGTLWGPMGTVWGGEGQLKVGNLGPPECSHSPTQDSWWKAESIWTTPCPFQKKRERERNQRVAPAKRPKPKDRVSPLGGEIRLRGVHHTTKPKDEQWGELESFQDFHFRLPSVRGSRGEGWLKRCLRAWVTRAVWFHAVVAQFALTHTFRLKQRTPT